MKRLVIDARESGTSTGRYIDKLVEYLHKLKPEFEIIILTKSHRLDYMKEIAPDFRLIKSDFEEFTFSEQFGFLKQLISLKADLVHFGMTQQPILYTGRVVTTIHDLTTLRFYNPAKNRLAFKFKQFVYHWVIWIVAHKSKRILTGSKFVKKDVAAFTHVSPKKITVTYEAADKITQQPKPIHGLTPNQFIMYVGRPLPHKNLKRLMEAFSILRRDRPELKLALSGGKHPLYDELLDWAEKEHIGGIVYTGFASEAELRWLYQNTAAYVFPSVSEGFGLPPLEAMHHGAPVVSSNATCLPEINGDAATYFDPLDIMDMVGKIGWILDNPKVADRLVARGYEQVKKYSWAKMAAETLEVYRQLLNKN